MSEGSHSQKGSLRRAQGSGLHENLVPAAGAEVIPPALVASLNTLGLSNDEARVYSTLVLFDYAEAKEIVEYLSLSKPSVYKALESLDNRGLALKQHSKPVKYRPISPEMATAILMKEHETAAETSLGALKKLERKKVRTGMDEPLWTIYGDSNTEHKIVELFRKASHHITFIIGERYIPVLDQIPVRRIPIRLVVITSQQGLAERLAGKFQGRPVEIHLIPIERLDSPPIEADIPEIHEAWKYLKFENVLEVNIDDEELLINAAFFSSGTSALNTRNKGAIIQMRTLSQLFWGRYIS